jgi:hypothetical protein
VPFWRGADSSRDVRESGSHRMNYRCAICHSQTVQPPPQAVPVRNLGVAPHTPREASPIADSSCVADHMNPKEHSHVLARSGWCAACPYHWQVSPVQLPVAIGGTRARSRAPRPRIAPGTHSGSSVGRKGEYGVRAPTRDSARLATQEIVRGVADLGEATCVQAPSLRLRPRSIPVGMRALDGQSQRVEARSPLPSRRADFGPCLEVEGLC